jgi:protein-S-isoprenylcysteine O-methyltransferase Ste14
MNKKGPKERVWLLAIVGTVAVGLVIIVSAGTIYYWQAWVFLALLAVSGLSINLYLTKHDPALLASRTKFGPGAEQRPVQKFIVALMSIPAIGGFIVPALDHRFGWSSVPLWLEIAGNLLFILSMWMVYRVYKENSFGSATIEIAKDQKVITTGPYAIVRNPMYASAVLFYIGMTLALGSYWGLIPALLMIPAFALRLFDEEKFLAINLPGYTEYCAKVRWHLIPGIF